MAGARVERRLAAILAGDVAGYSRMMGADEEGTLLRLNTHRREFLEPKIAEYRGRIVKRTGDGVLIEFASAVDATRCAVEIQRGIVERNAPVPEDKRIELRIGIHIGDVIIEDGDIFGDGVNIAARLESIAEPGGICISDDAYRQVHGKLDANFQDGGEQELKNISRPVRVYRLQPGGGTAEASALVLPDRPSIAVLPFQNLSGDPEQEYFADGMVEDIITGLSRIKWLFVIARNSTFTYKGRAVDVKQVGRELGVAMCLKVACARLPIACASRGSSSTPPPERTSGPSATTASSTIFSRCRTRSRCLSSAQSSRAFGSPRPSASSASDRTASTPTIWCCRHRPASIRECRRALALDPSYALAHAYAAECHHSIYLRGGLHEESRAASIRHAEAAIEYGQDDALALTFAGFVIGMDKHDRAAAFSAFEAALTISPSSAVTYIQGSVILALSGEAERAIEWAERGLRLSPVDPWRSSALVGLAFANFHRARYEDAEAAARKAAQISPGFSIPHMLFAASLAKIGRADEAKAAAARVLELQPGFRYSRLLAGAGCTPPLAASLSEALHSAGLPQ